MTKVLIALVIIMTFFLTSMFGAVLWPLGLMMYFFIKSYAKNILYLAAFLLGLENDILTGMPLGLSAVVLLCFACALSISEVKFHKNLRVVFLLAIISQLVYYFLFKLS